MQDSNTMNHGLSPDSSLCFGLGNKRALVKVRETLTFHLNVPANKLNTLSVNNLLICSVSTFCHVR